MQVFTGETGHTELQFIRKYCPFPPNTVFIYVPIYYKNKQPTYLIALVN